MFFYRGQRCKVEYACLIGPAASSEIDSFCFRMPVWCFVHSVYFVPGDK
jgi:hypothetical protein